MHFSLFFLNVHDMSEWEEFHHRWICEYLRWWNRMKYPYLSSLDDLLNMLIKKIIN